MLSSVEVKLAPYTAYRAAFAPCAEPLSDVLPSFARNE